MKNIQVLEWNSFLKGEVVAKKKDNEKLSPIIIKLSASSIVLILMPEVVDAEGLSGSTFSSIFDTVLTVADYACWGTIIYCGGTWMFGNRTKALEILLGTAIGYIIIRHAKDIQEWLAAI